MTPHHEPRSVTTSIIFFAIAVWALAMSFGCAPASSPTSPSVTIASAALTSPAAAPAQEPVAVVPAPPVAADPPTSAPAPACVDRGLNFDYRNRNTPAVDNNTCATVTLTLYVNELTSQPKDTYSEFTATIEPGKRGYFSVSKPPCKPAQYDWRNHARGGYSHGNPHYAGGSDNIWVADLSHPSCAPPPPPPPPVCIVQPAGACGPWIAATVVGARPAECTVKSWTRACPQTCNAPPLIEGPILSCLQPQ